MTPFVYDIEWLRRQSHLFLFQLINHPFDYFHNHVSCQHQLKLGLREPDILFPSSRSGRLGNGLRNYRVRSPGCSTQQNLTSNRYDYATGDISSNVEDQAEQALRNISYALKDAGSCMAEVVRVRYILPDGADFEQTWPVLRRWFGDVKPAATMIQASLMKEEMKIEIEVTAKKGSADSRS